MRATIYDTEAEARRAIRAIDQARGETEELRLPDGRRVQRPTKTWAHPVPLRDGTWAVPLERRLDSIAGREETIDGVRVRVPSVDDERARTVTDDEREDTRTRETEPDAPTRTR